MRYPSHHHHHHHHHHHQHPCTETEYVFITVPSRANVLAVECEERMRVCEVMGMPKHQHMWVCLSSTHCLSTLGSQGREVFVVRGLVTNLDKLTQW